MLDRRNFLQYFGIGATIVPLVAGMPKMDAGAKLIEVPKVDIVAANSMSSAFSMTPFVNREKLKMQVNFINGKGELYCFEADTFLTTIEPDFADVSMPSDHPYRRYERMEPTRVYWTMKGTVVGTGTVTLPVRFDPTSERAR